MRLAGKVALITGAGRGIGEGIARKFLAEGARVFVTDRNVDEGEALVRDLSRASPSVWFLKLDVSVEQDWKDAMTRVKERVGRLDVLVSNAGINIRDPIEQMTEANLDAMLAVNVKGPFLGMKHAIPLLRDAGGGSIVCTSSICGLVGHRYTPEAYTMVKGALTLLARSVAVRYAKDNIRCNCVHPSTVETSLTGTMLSDPARRAERVGEVPLGRLAAVEDVAAAFVYLASDEARFVNGVSFPVDGGLTAS